MRHSYLTPDPNYENLDLYHRLENANLNFTPLAVPATFTNPTDGMTWETGERTVIRPTATDNDGKAINPRIATVGGDYCLTDYETLFSRFDAPLIDSGFKPGGCHSFKNGGGARMFYTRTDANFGKRTGGHNKVKDAPRKAVFYVQTGINGLWSTGFGGYLLEQWCSNGASKEIWAAQTGGIRHTKTHNDRLEDAIKRFDWIAADMAQFSDRLNQLEKIKADSETVKAFCLALLPDTSEGNKARAKQRATLGNYIVEESFSRNRAVTFQDLLQGVTALNTHEKSKSAESVFERVLTGQGVKLFEQAVKWVDEKAGV